MSFLDVITAGLLKGTGQALQVEYETGIESRRLSEEKKLERQKKLLDTIKENQTKEQELVVGGNFVVGSAALEAFSGQKRTMFGEGNEMFLNPNSNGYKAYKLGTDYASSKQSFNSIIDTQYTTVNNQKSNLFEDVFFRHVDSETGQIKKTAQSHDVKIYNTIKNGLVTNLSAAASDLRDKSLTQEGGKDIKPNLYKEFEDEINKMKSMGAPDAFIDDVFMSALGFDARENRAYTGRNINKGKDSYLLNFGTAPTDQEKNIAANIAVNSNPHENINQVTNQKIFEAREIADKIASDKYTSIDVLNGAQTVNRLLVDGKIDYVTGDPRRNFKVIGGAAVRQEVENALKPIMALPSVGDRISLVALAMPDDFLENKSAGRMTAYAQKTSVEFEKDIMSAITGIDDIAKYQETLTLRVKNSGTLTSRLSTIESLLTGDNPAIPGIAGDFILGVDAVSKTFDEVTKLFNLDTKDEEMSEDFQEGKKLFSKYSELTIDEALNATDNQVEKTRMLRYLLTETVFTIARTLENPEGKGARLSKSDIDAIIEATNFGAKFTSAQQIMAITKLLKRRMAYDLAEAEHLLDNFTPENIQAAKFLRRQSGKSSDPTFMADFDADDIDSQKAAFSDFLLDLGDDIVAQRNVKRDPVTGAVIPSGTDTQQQPKTSEIEELQVDRLSKKSGSAYGQ